ncbi:MAG: crossover junction endodeoxyribonuclease RuvC [Chloroflexi bacterium]|nr:crossover junction endodeoxyribonuclease RuvC [Chloroflexota bacterium]
MSEVRRRILGIDPGSARLGFGVVDCDGPDLQVVRFGCLETSPTDATSVRLYALYRQLTEVIAGTEPSEIAVEELFFNKNARTVIAVAQARGVALLSAAEYGVPIYEYTPLQVKVSVVGFGRAEKRQVQRMVTSMLQLSEIPEPDDVADALAVAICHSQQRGSRIADLLRQPL